MNGVWKACKEVISHSGNHYTLNIYLTPSRRLQRRFLRKHPSRNCLERISLHYTWNLRVIDSRNFNAIDCNVKIQSVLLGPVYEYGSWGFSVGESLAFCREETRKVGDITIYFRAIITVQGDANSFWWWGSFEMYPISS